MLCTVYYTLISHQAFIQDTMKANLTQIKHRTINGSIKYLNRKCIFKECITLLVSRVTTELTKKENKTHSSTLNV